MYSVVGNDLAEGYVTGEVVSVRVRLPVFVTLISDAVVKGCFTGEVVPVRVGVPVFVTLISDPVLNLMFALLSEALVTELPGNF